MAAIAPFVRKIRRAYAAQAAAPLLTRASGAIAAFAAAFGLAAAPLSDAAARGLIRDSEIERTLRWMSDPIFQAANMPPESVELFIINDQSINAFVNGGRNVFVHTGLLLELETAEQVMGVLAHETGHITAGHVIARVDAARAARIQAIVSSLIGVGAAVAGGGAAGLGLGQAGASVAQRNLLRFTRAQEASADQSALILLERVGVDPSGMLQVLERLEREQAIYLSGVDPYALTHPLSSERIRLLRANVSRSRALGAPVDADLRYWHGRMRAKIDGFLTSLSAATVARFDDPELALYRDAIRLHRQPDPAGALAAIEKLIAQRPQDPFYWELKGQILFESGRGPEAVEPYRRAATLAPDMPLIRAGLGEALLSQGNAASDREALQMLEQAAIAEPFAPGLRRPLALAYARTGQDGMAAVVTAERMALLGRIRDAKIQAERAKALLPTGSPGWLRAEDISELRTDRR